MTPTRALRILVSQGRSPPYPDPAVKGLTDWTLVPDHIIPFKDIVRMPGFALLSRKHMLEVLNFPRNFIGLTPSANSSRQDKGWLDWLVHKVTGRPVDPNFANKMWRKERQLRIQLLEEIQNRLDLQGYE